MSGRHHGENDSGASVFGINCGIRYADKDVDRNRAAEDRLLKCVKPKLIEGASEAYLSDGVFGD